MEIITVVTGMLEENAYLVYEEGQKDAVVIDPGDDAEAIIAEIQGRGLRLTDILLTHGHADHIAATERLREAFGAKVHIHSADAYRLEQPDVGEAVYVGTKFGPFQADETVEQGDVIQAAGLRFEVLHTPGHTEGGVCYLVGDAMFTGDTLFLQSIGRTDFAGSDPRAMGRSLELLRGLEGDYRVYPGHGPATTLEHERKYNMYLRVR